MKLSIILKCSKISLIFLKAIISTYCCAGSYELKRRLKNIESSQPKLITDTKSLFFIKLGLNLIKQDKFVPAFWPWNQIHMHFDKMSTNRHCRHFCPIFRDYRLTSGRNCYFTKQFFICFWPPPLCQTGKRGKKVPQTILAKLCAPSPPPLQVMPIWNQHISKRGFPNWGSLAKRYV